MRSGTDDRGSDKYLATKPLCELNLSRGPDWLRKEGPMVDELELERVRAYRDESPEPEAVSVRAARADLMEAIRAAAGSATAGPPASGDTARASRRARRRQSVDLVPPARIHVDERNQRKDRSIGQTTETKHRWLQGTDDRSMPPTDPAILLPELHGDPTRQLRS